jgi:diguanylate cyclase (GGDEF)-like protein
MTGAGVFTFVVGGLLVLGSWALGAAELPETYRSLAGVLAEPLALLLVALAWRFRRSRLALSAIVIALANVVTRGPLDFGAGGLGDPGLAALALLFPINLTVIVLMRDHPLPRRGPLIHLAAVLLQPWLVAALFHIGSRMSWREAAAPEWLRLISAPQAALLAALIAGVFAALAFAARRGTFEIAVLWVLAAGAIALVGNGELHRATLMFAGAQLVLLFALVEDSYRLAYHDQLTGLAGRRALDEAMKLLDGEYTIAMVDIDRFKRFNDRYGHEAGDQALRMVADQIERVGGGGRAYRYGGEEFAVLFSAEPPTEVQPHLEQLRADVADRLFSVRSASRPRKKPEQPVRPSTPVEEVMITISIGAAGPSLQHPDPASVLRAADAALYRAKKRGRNRVVIEGVRAKTRAARR